MRAGALTAGLLAISLVLGGCATSDSREMLRGFGFVDRHNDDATATFFAGYDSSVVFGEPPPVPASVQQSLDDIAQRLSVGRDRPLSVKVADCDDFNAFSTPEGAIYVCRGAVVSAGSADVLAFLIAHELGHIDLGHASGLDRIEQAQRRGQQISAVIGLTTGAIVVGGVVYYLFAQSEPAFYDFSDYLGIGENEDGEGFGEDKTLLAVLGAAFVYFASTGSSFYIADFARGRAQSFTQRAYVERAPREEFAADAYALQSMQQSGFSPLGADFALSAERVDGGALGAGQRAAFGDVGTEADGAEGWRHILLSYRHPALDERRERLERSLDDVDDDAAGEDLDLCAEGADGGACQRWLDAALAVQPASVLFLRVAHATANDEDDTRRRLCADLHGVVMAASDGLGADRGVARLALSASLLCREHDWSTPAFAPYTTPGRGGYDYLKELSSTFAALNQAAAAYSMASRLSEVGGENAVTFADFSFWAEALGFGELARRAVLHCETGARGLLVADRGRYCAEVYERARAAAPEHSRVTLGSGLHLRQQLIGIWHLPLMRAALSQARTREQQISLLRGILGRSAAVPSIPATSAEPARRWCPSSNNRAGQVFSVVSQDASLISWLNDDVRCLTPELLRTPAH